jgi:hypothetical protein
VRVGIWLPWQVWVVAIMFGFPLYLCWAVIAVGVFALVVLGSWPFTRSFRRSLRLGGLTFAAMIVPGHMIQQHNTRVLARTVRGTP